MSKAIAHSTDWRGRAGSFSTHGTRTGLNVLGWDADTMEHMTPEQERAALAARSKQLNEILASSTLSTTQRRILGRERFQIDQRINRLRPKMRTPGIEKYVLDIVRERFSRPEWDALFKEAKRRHAAEQNEAPAHEH